MVLCRLLFDRNIKQLDRHKVRWWDYLDEGNIEKIDQEATSLLPKDTTAGKDSRQQIGYFEKNMERMRYKEFKEKGLFIGSGVIEAGCKSVVGQRLKQSGMECSLRRADAIIALRCIEKSNRTEQYWQERTA